MFDKNLHRGSLSFYRDRKCLNNMYFHILLILLIYSTYHVDCHVIKFKTKIKLSTLDSGHQ